jgi:endonuclease/exonuclease/phosphatase family metal-dependent hydrolase
MKVILKIFSLVLVLVSLCFAQNQHTIMTYNILNYGTNTADTTERNPHFRTIFSSIQPDIIVAQEVLSQAAVNGFLNRVLNAAASGYSAGTFIDGPDTDNAIFFKSSFFQFISNTPIPTALRDINEFKLVYIPTGDTLRIFSLHLKAGSGSTEQNQRAAEVAVLRNYTNSLPFGTNFIVTGDFNIYGSTETAYQNLIAQTGTGYVIDPFNLSGSWNVSSYAAYHTQSPRVRQFGGGSTGGMDDRFDLILMSRAIMDAGGITFIPGSYINYGNDGNHFNDSINRPPNTAVGQTIADALHNAADHIPVYARFSITAPLNLQLSLKTYVEALFNGTSMIPDSITVELRTSSHPYALVDQDKILLNSSGQGSFIFHDAVNGVPYYLVVKHRNSIETWSASAMSFSSNSLSYDFTTASNKAYGNNMVLRGGKWCIFSGDINQDGYINNNDLNQVYTSNVSGIQENTVTDLNKDFYTEIQDLSLVFKNKVLGIQKISP